MVESVLEDASVDEVWQTFIRWLATFGSAAEVEPGVIRVDFDPFLQGADSLQELEMNDDVLGCITKYELKFAAYTEFNVFDDTDALVIPRTSTPVSTGRAPFIFYAHELIATLPPGETFLVYHQGSMHRSTRRELPPRRSKQHWD